MANVTLSIRHPLRRFGQLLTGPLRVPRRRRQVFVAEDLSQRHQIVLVVCQELVAECVPEDVRVQLHAEVTAVSESAR